MTLCHIVFNFENELFETPKHSDSGWVHITKKLHVLTINCVQFYVLILCLQVATWNSTVTKVGLHIPRVALRVTFRCLIENNTIQESK